MKMVWGGGRLEVREMIRYTQAWNRPSHTRARHENQPEVNKTALLESAEPLRIMWQSNAPA